MKTIVAGSRGWNDYELLAKTLDALVPEITVLVSGTAAGADRLGERWASARNIPVERYPADWTRYGKRAGFLRNTQMADVSDRLVAFWDGQSRGTQHMIQVARRLGLVVLVVREGSDASASR